MRRIILATALLAPIAAQAQAPATVQLPDKMLISTQTVENAIQHLKAGGAYTDGQMIAADLLNQANAIIAAQLAAQQKAAADAAAHPATTPTAPALTKQP